jgi:hypothetical protein
MPLGGDDVSQDLIIHKYGIIVKEAPCRVLTLGRDIKIWFLEIQTLRDAQKCGGMEFCQIAFRWDMDEDARMYMWSRVRAPGHVNCPDLSTM